MKTIRLLYPDHVSGGLKEYYFGAKLLQHILPPNKEQKLVEVEVAPPDDRTKPIEHGIYAEREVLSAIRDAQKKLAMENPERIITIGGNCMVSLAPFDYLHARYEQMGILWIDAHPDVSTLEDGYPNAHAMVLGSLLGHGAPQLRAQMKNRPFHPDELLYVGLQKLHDYQEAFLQKTGVSYKVQDKGFLSDSEIIAFAKRFGHIAIHFDIDVLDEHFFHSTYFANTELVGDGSGGGKMRMETLSRILELLAEHSEIVAFTIAEYLPFDEYQLYKTLAKLPLFTD